MDSRSDAGLEHQAVCIRLMVPGDDAPLERVIRSVMTEFGADRPGCSHQDPEVGAMFAAYQRPGSAYFVAMRDDTVLGGAGIAPLTGGPADVCELRKMYLIPAARGLGLGARLLERCLEAAGRLGYVRCYLETLAGMTTANALYRSFGFVPCLRPMGDTGHSGCDVWYVLDLGSQR